jgi:hypothetical protein
MATAQSCYPAIRPGEGMWREARTRPKLPRTGGRKHGSGRRATSRSATSPAGYSVQNSTISRLES